MIRQDAEIAYFQAAQPDSVPYALQCSSGTTCYADQPPGWYDCWAPQAAAGEHFRWAWLPMPDSSQRPTLPAVNFPAPTAATHDQTDGVPTGLDSGSNALKATGAAMAPATSSPLRLLIEPDQRLAILYSAAGPVTLYATRVL